MIMVYILIFVNKNFLCWYHFFRPASSFPGYFLLSQVIYPFVSCFVFISGTYRMPLVLWCPAVLKGWPWFLSWVTRPKAEFPGLQFPGCQTLLLSVFNNNLMSVVSHYSHVTSSYNAGNHFHHLCSHMQVTWVCSVSTCSYMQVHY